MKELTGGKKTAATLGRSHYQNMARIANKNRSKEWYAAFAEKGRKAKAEKRHVDNPS